MNSTFRRTVTVAAIAAGCLAATSSPGACQDVRRVTLEQALELFARNNLDLRLARTEAAEASALARQVAGYPNPTLSATHEELEDGATEASESYLNLSQRLEWPGTRSARQEEAVRRAEAARARLAADSAHLAFRVKEAYTRAARAERTLEALRRVTYVFREGARRADERYREGDISRYDRRRIQVERTRYETRLADAELEAAALGRDLALLVMPQGDAVELRPAAEALAEPAPPGAGDVTLAAALDRRAEMEVAGAALAAARSATDATRGQRIPDLTATGGFKRQSDGLTGVFLGLSLPVPIWDRRAGAVDAAVARTRAAEDRASLTRRQVENDVRRALERYRSLNRRADLLDRGPLEEPGDLLDMAQVAYAEGEMELVELLDAAEAFLDARESDARLRADLWISYYDLERAVGGFGEPASEGGMDR